ncbi:hypothetical protein JB92DRAFT_3069071 [Gautieria morchelliformis]|nr:hypothetical protein JB92DRAFT_3069071 [Gautieria morchelliformis]
MSPTGDLFFIAHPFHLSNLLVAFISCATTWCLPPQLLCSRPFPHLVWHLNWTMNIPCVPRKPLMQQGGVIKVNIKMLHLDDKQIEEIQQHYETNAHFSKLYSDNVESQQAAWHVLREQKLDLRNLADLGNGWSIRWTTHGGTGAKVYTRHLLQW